MYDYSKFPSVCRICFKSVLDFNLNSPVQSDQDGLCLTYEDLLNELSFIPPEEHASGLPAHLCEECSRQLDDFLSLRQQTTLILKFSIALLEAKENKNSQPMIDLFKYDGDQLRRYLCRLNLIDDKDFPLDNLLNNICGSCRTETNDKASTDNDILFEEVKVDDIVTEVFDRQSDSENSYTDIAQHESESGGYKEPTSKRKKTQKVDLKPSSKIIRKGGQKYKLCSLTGCNKEYLVGNRTAYLEHEKTFHRYACNVCGRVLASRTSFRNHVLLHDGDEAKAKCDFCERTFTTKGSMMVHIREVHNNTGIHFNCQYCGKGFMEQKDLHLHLHEHRECKLCDETFADLPGWINHTRKQHPDTLFTCDHCDHTSLSRALLDRHMRMKHSERSNNQKPQRFTIYAINSATFYQCPQCSLQFTNEELLLQHNDQVHNRSQVEKPDRPTVKRRSKEEREKFALRYSCDICGKKYRFKNSLWSHKHKEHNMGNQKSICDVCGQNFKHHSYLTAHIANKHATELPYQCEHCSKAYSQAYLLKEHLKSHAAEKKHKCPHCDYRAKQSHALKDHIIRMHTTERPAKCSECDKAFINNNDLKKHMAVHNEEMPFQCEECDQVFRRKMDLGRHRARVHLVVGSKQRKVPAKVIKAEEQCTVCKATFRRKNDLTKHLSRVHPNAQTEVDKRETSQPEIPPQTSGVLVTVD
ncbi:zinc finger protein 62 homolog [Ochlerotatus camptorhynchus]|uniref:zinc finger protein 62 homolog n=1 Tax=Ochlerotatus camptorhynchus TaxID=644619 RepID=UPI0031D11652